MIRSFFMGIGLLLCGFGIHWRKYWPHIEYGIIDGPPRVFAKVTCTRCGHSYISRDRDHAEKGKAAARKLGHSSVWWY